MMNDDSRDDRATSPGLIVPAVVDQHVEELAGLWNTRQVSLESGHVALRHLARLDERIAAHEDGCLVAGGEGTRRLREQLADAGAAQAFAAATAALNAGDRDAFLRLAAIAEAAPKAASGIASALGWLEPDRLAGIVRELLTAQSPHHRRLGLTACRLHAVDPGSHLLTGLRDAHPGPRVEALRCAGTLGRTELVPECSDALHHADPEVQLWAAWSMVLLGDRGSALDALTAVGRRLGRHTSRAFRLSIQAMRITAAHGMLQELAADPQRLRRLVHGSGVVGDPAYVPWLIGRMSDDKTSRAAGEAFGLVTGADLALLDLERRPPEDLESGPNDDPDDPGVEMDDDDGLPWPDVAKVEDWWGSHGGRFQKGTRYFIGAPVTREHCVEVLKNGYQRQRILAAHYLCLLDPGTPLFNTSAPARRQQRLLAGM